MSQEQISALRSVAHPVRLRILSLLTGAAMSATEVAQELGIAHASASYHLRVLYDAGEILLDSEEKVRGGTTKRYRYAIGDKPDSPRATVEDQIAYQTATSSEIVRRLTGRVRGPSNAGDIETWVAPEVWAEAVRLLSDAMALLHAEARPPRTPDTIHVSATTAAFVMGGDE